MKNLRKFLIACSLFVLGLSAFLFVNFVSPGASYEVPYQSGTGIALSEIVAASQPIVEPLGHRPGGIPVDLPPLTVEIRANEVAYIDQSVTVDTLIINGQLHCDANLAQNDIVIKARAIYVNGLLQCGTKFNPYSKKISFSLRPGFYDPKTTDSYRSLVVNNGGKLILTGQRRKSGWTKLAATANPGDTFILLPSMMIRKDDQTLDVSLEASTARTLSPQVANAMGPGWDVGDEIVVGPTSYSPEEAEAFTIVSIQGNKINLNRPVTYKHLGVVETYQGTYNGQVKLDLRAEVANLSRNIRILPDESAGAIPLDQSSPNAEVGGHVMVMKGGEAYVDSAEFYHMGQAGILGRYPFHWHLVDNAPGQFIKNSSIHHSFQRCVTVHETNQTLVHNNVCYNFKGHGYFLEDGEEVYNTLSHNLGIKSNYPYLSKTLLVSDKIIGGEAQGRFPNVSVFWISHPQNTIINNVASGSVGVGFWMSYENETHDEHGVVTGHPILENTLKFESNTAHSAQVGFTWDGAKSTTSANNPLNPLDRVLEPVYYKPSAVAQFKKLTSFRNKLSGVYFRGYTAVFDGGISADNGWHYWLAYNQIVKNASIIGRSQNFYSQDQILALSGSRGDRYLQTGLIQYDGPFELDRVDFLNYPTQKLYSSSGLDVTPIPLGVTGGTERLTNMSRRVSFHPEPIHRAFMLDETNVGAQGVDGNVSLRDVDGTFTGIPGGMLVGKMSLGAHAQSGCVDGGMSFYTFKKCPSTYTESQLHLFDGIGNPNPWSMPFVAQRNDGALSVPMSFWNYFLGIHGYPRIGGNKVALANTMSASYQLMLANLKSPRFWVTSEIANPIIPVTKVTGQGSNCYLENIPSVNSLSALSSSTTSAYFSNGNDFYFRLIPHIPYEFITANNGYGSALRYKSESTLLNCNNDPTPNVKGYVDAVTKNADGSVKIRGWACDYSKNSQINVGLTIKNALPVSPLIRAPAFSSPPFSVTVQANKTSEAAVAFECGVPDITGFRWEYTLTPLQAQTHAKKIVYAIGMSSSGGANLPLNQSGQFTIPK